MRAPTSISIEPVEYAMSDGIFEQFKEYNWYTTKLGHYFHFTAAIYCSKNASALLWYLTTMNSNHLNEYNSEKILKHTGISRGDQIRPALDELKRLGFISMDGSTLYKSGAFRTAALAYNYLYSDEIENGDRVALDTFRLEPGELDAVGIDEVNRIYSSQDPEYIPQTDTQMRKRTMGGTPVRLFEPPEYKSRPRPKREEELADPYPRKSRKAHSKGTTKTSLSAENKEIEEPIQASRETTSKEVAAKETTSYNPKQEESKTLVTTQAPLKKDDDDFFF